MKRIVATLVLAAFVSLFFSACCCDPVMVSAKRLGQTLPPPEKRVDVPKKKSEICPECADRMKPEVAKTPEPPTPPIAVAVPTHVLTDVNFDFDKYAIRKQDEAILRGNLNWFDANQGKKVRVEGHCDERGTIAYNLVLGQKRADAVRKFLIDLGIDSFLLDTVSYGKEKPVSAGHDEKAWAENRRVHFEPME
jgi:peptidoglycan-associated lipoprotein